MKRPSDGKFNSPPTRTSRTASARWSASSSATGVALQWEQSPPATGEPVGAYIYRRRGDDLASLVLLTPSPVTGTSYEDQRLERGVTYVYLVRQVVAVDGQLVEGAASNTVRGALAEPE